MSAAGDPSRRHEPLVAPLPSDGLRRGPGRDARQRVPERGTVGPPLGKVWPGRHWPRSNGPENKSDDSLLLNRKRLAQHLQRAEAPMPYDAPKPPGERIMALAGA
jgi:hypothetical protein